MQDDEMQATVRNSSCAPHAHVTRAPSPARELAESRPVIPAPAVGAVGEGPASREQSRAFLHDGGGFCSASPLWGREGQGQRRTCRDLCPAP